MDTCISTVIVDNLMETGIEILDESVDNNATQHSQQLEGVIKNEEIAFADEVSNDGPDEREEEESHSPPESRNFMFSVVMPSYDTLERKFGAVSQTNEQIRACFKGVHFYGIHLSDKAKQILLDRMAVQEMALTKSLTHVVAGKDVGLYNAEVVKAGEMNKLVVYEDWVEMCQKYSTLLPPHAYRVQRKRLFIGKKICLSKLSVSDRKRLHFLITHYGGICTLKLDRTCTHLVTGVSEGRKYEKAVKQSSHIEVVDPDWVTKSIAGRQTLSPKQFNPNRLVDSVESNYLHAIDSVLTGAFLGKTQLDLNSSSHYGQHMSGLVTKTALGGPGRKKQLKDSAGRFKGSNLGPKSPGMLTKKKLSKNAAKPGGYFVTGGSLLSLQKNHPQPGASGASSTTSNPLSPPASNVVIPPGSKFHAHDPEQHIPSECCLVGCRFLVAEFENLATHQEVEMWKKVIDNYGGTASGPYSKITHVICTSQNSKVYKKSIHDCKRIVTPYWLNEVVKRKSNFAPDEAIYFPVAFPPTRSILQGKYMSICGFSVEEREKIKLIFHTLGVKYSPAFNQNCFALICRELNNEKVRKAQEWSIPIYNVEWLSNLLIRGKVAIETSSSAIYQNYDKEDPFKIDVLSYRELHKFMTAWLKPLKVNPGEIRKRSAYWDFLLLKQKQVSDDPSSASLRKMRPNTSEGGQPKEYVLFPPSRPLDQMPKVVFTGYDLPTLEKLKMKLFSLGGQTALTMADCTHVCAPTVMRTVKFLIGVCTVEHFVTQKWIEDSFDCKWWQNESSYVPENIQIEKLLGFRLLGSLKRAKEKKLLNGYRVYMTPGVEPDFTTLQLVVEAAGGRMLRLEPESASCYPNMQSIIVSCEKDLPMCAKYIGRNIGVYSVELILAGALTQELELDRFKLELKAKTLTPVPKEETVSNIIAISEPVDTRDNRPSVEMEVEVSHVAQSSSQLPMPTNFVPETGTVVEKAPYKAVVESEETEERDLKTPVPETTKTAVTDIKKLPFTEVAALPETIVQPSNSRKISVPQQEKTEVKNFEEVSKSLCTIETVVIKTEAETSAAEVPNILNVEPVQTVSKVFDQNENEPMDQSVSSNVVGGATVETTTSPKNEKCQKMEGS